MMEACFWRVICDLMLQHRYVKRDALLHGSEDESSMELGYITWNQLYMQNRD